MELFAVVRHDSRTGEYELVAGSLQGDKDQALQIAKAACQVSQDPKVCYTVRELGTANEVTWSAKRNQVEVA